MRLRTVAEAVEFKRKNRLTRLNSSRRFQSQVEADFAPDPNPEGPSLVPEPGVNLASLDGKKFLTVTSLIALLVFLLLFFIYTSMNFIKLGRDISRLTDEKTKLVEVNRRLKAQMYRLTVFGDFEQVARELGLITPTTGQIVIVSNDSPR
jgi:hypothetical protein